MSQVPRADSRPDVSLDSRESGYPFLHLSWDDKFDGPTNPWCPQATRPIDAEEQIPSNLELLGGYIDWLQISEKKSWDSRPALRDSSLLFLFGNQTDQAFSVPKKAAMCHNFHSIPTLCVKRAKNARWSFVELFWTNCQNQNLQMVLWAQIAIVPLSGLLCQIKKAEGNNAYNSLLLLTTFSPMQMHWALSLLQYWPEFRYWPESDLSVSQDSGSVFKPVCKKCIITLWVLWLHVKVCLAKPLVSKGKAINGMRHDYSRETISCSSETRQRCGLPSTCSCLARPRLGLPQVDAAHAKINSFR